MKKRHQPPPPEPPPAVMGSDAEIPEAIASVLRKRTSREWKELLAHQTFEDQAFLADWVEQIKAAALGGKKWANDVLMKLIEEPAQQVINNYLLELGLVSQEENRSIVLEHKRAESLPIEAQVRLCEEFVLKAYDENPEFAIESPLMRRLLAARVEAA